MRQVDRSMQGLADQVEMLLCVAAIGRAGRRRVGPSMGVQEYVAALRARLGGRTQGPQPCGIGVGGEVERFGRCLWTRPLWVIVAPATEDASEGMIERAPIGDSDANLRQPRAQQADEELPQDGIAREVALPAQVVLGRGEQRRQRIPISSRVRRKRP